MLAYEDKKVFFLGGNTPQGFVSRFDQLAESRDWHTYVIQGAPGTGKSGCLKELSRRLSPACQDVELILCSSDPDSLDGVLFRDLKVSVADGTAPHVITSRYPLAYDTVLSLEQYCDREAISRQKEKIRDLFDRGEECSRQCCKYLYAAQTLLDDTYRIALRHTDLAKIERFAQRFCAREIRPALPNRRPQESVRFLSAFTGQGLVMLEKTARALAREICFIQDDYGVVSRELMACLRREILARGYDIVTCYCPMAPYDKIDHIFIPALSLGLMSQNRFHRLKLEPVRTIHAQRFTDLEAVKRRKTRIACNAKGARQMLEHAHEVMAESARLHRELEACYIPAMDYGEAAGAFEALAVRLLAGKG